MRLDRFKGELGPKRQSVRPKVRCMADVQSWSASIIGEYLQRLLEDEQAVESRLGGLNDESH